MSMPGRVQQADMARRQAMIAGDIDRLDSLLAADLTWTHSSGVTEDKAQVLAAIARGDVRYAELNIEQDQFRETGGLVIHNGLLLGQASRGGLAKSLRAKFLAVWRLDDDTVQLCAWQSTNSEDD